MNENISDKEMNKALFAQMVMMLSSSTMQQLGKLVNPVTHKAEVDLEGAQITIDTLIMLREKTRGNLDKDEEAMLTSVLSSLQMNYVETMQSSPPPPEATAKESQEQQAVPETNESHSAQESQNTEKKDTKYHKSYGG
ncbi:MAG: hypothetical protein A2283_08610 [Lentisphaerae bacterium RIFOXYA12_FULL_48_11]|nr:MAG: hypothetical protein A2283_08610 [Lentisphaerae bacterium RIFOXYA12_FULL_48_11]